jgi:hypothetical protein
MSLWKYIFEFWLEKLKLAITKGENEVVRQFTGTRIPDPPFSSFGPSRDYGMDLCLEVYLWTIYPYFTTFRVTILSFY